MYFQSLACDFDGTLAHDGNVSSSTIASIAEVKRTGRRVILVTGRRLAELMRVFPEFSIFDLVVAENGAVIYEPLSREQRRLADPPPPEFALELRKSIPAAVESGEVIVATWSPHEGIVLDTIRRMGLEMQVIFNKGAVMVLPSGINKATGLQQALRQLGLSEHNTVAIGDAENDHAMFSACECAVAVANALPVVRAHADLTTRADHGDGVSELCGILLDNDLRSIATKRHDLVIGSMVQLDGKPAVLDGKLNTVLLAGPSGSGKTLLGLSIAEQIGSHGYQFCLIDPERDFDELDDAVVLGDSHRPPTIQEVTQALLKPSVNVVVSLLGLSHSERPVFFSRLLLALQELRALYGRPHWIIADEAHYLLPHEPELKAGIDEAKLATNLVLLTVHPNHLNRRVLNSVDVLIATPTARCETLKQFCGAIDEQPPDFDENGLTKHDYIFWNRKTLQPPVVFAPTSPKQEHHRHLRKYAEGDLGAYHSFYFRGPDRRLNLKAQNLQMFIQILEGIDDQTWMFHLRRHDYSKWFRGSIRYGTLANQAAALEDDQSSSPGATKEAIKTLISAKYTAPV